MGAIHVNTIFGEPTLYERKTFMKKRPSLKKQEKIDAVVEKMVDGAPQAHLKTDPQGMYTGVGVDPYEKPVQDADDL